MTAQQKPADTNVARAAGGLWLRLPDGISERLLQFMVDNASGNVQLNIERGQVRKLVITEHIR